MKPTTQTTESKEGLQEKWEVSPYKEGMIGLNFKDAVNTIFICECFGNNRKEVSDLICKAVNERQSLINVNDVLTKQLNTVTEQNQKLLDSNRELLGAIDEYLSNGAHGGKFLTEQAVKRHNSAKEKLESAINNAKNLQS